MSTTGGQSSPIEVLRETTRASLESRRAQERPEMGGNNRGRALRQVPVIFTLVSLCFHFPHPKHQRRRSELFSRRLPLAFQRLYPWQICICCWALIYGICGGIWCREKYLRFRQNTCGIILFFR